MWLSESDCKVLIERKFFFCSFQRFFNPGNFMVKGKIFSKILSVFAKIILINEIDYSIHISLRVPTTQSIVLDQGVAGRL